MNTKIILSQVVALAESCRYEKEHSHQDARLALRLFDELKALHRLGEKERVWLESAALLHDIGWCRGRARHHKTARDMIVGSEKLPALADGRTIVALVARYHRRAFPQDTHKYYAGLNAREKNVVNILSALLRIADGLDRSHSSPVKDLQCRVTSRKVFLKIVADVFPEPDRMTGKQKADLFEKVFQRDVVIE